MGKRGRPPSSPPPPIRTTNLNNSCENKYKSVSLFPEESIGDGGNGVGDGRAKKNKNNRKCGCWVCIDVTKIIEDEINSLQKLLSHTKQDTNKILDEIAKLKEYFLK